jgi:filamentous hemagglutinin family protein
MRGARPPLRKCARRAVTRPAQPCSFDLRPTVLALAAAAMLSASPVRASPSGATVVQGQAALRQQGSTLTVTTSNGAVINWKQFSIGEGETTRFVQPSATSQVLNRVVGTDPSVILGTLESNGRVFLINPNGVAFGKGSRVDVSGLVVSTLKLSDADFAAGRLNFGELGAGAAAGGIRQEGRISTGSSGFVYLVAPQVENSGVIHTPEGEVILAAGHRVSLVNPRTREVAWEVAAPESQAVNLGEVVARRIVMQAGTVRNAGTLRATTAVLGEDGQVLLKAARRVEQSATGRIVAHGVAGNGALRGGLVDIIAGEQVALQGRIDVTPGPAREPVPPAAGAAPERLGTGVFSLPPAPADPTPRQPSPVAVQASPRDAAGQGSGSTFGGAGVLAAPLFSPRGAAGPRDGFSLVAADAVGAQGAPGVPRDAPGANPPAPRTGGAARLPDPSGPATPEGPTTPWPAPPSGPDPRHALPPGTLGTGGRVRIFARHIALGEGLSVDASGPGGGGTVLVGGEKQGAFGGAPNAFTLRMHESARIAADATERGDGGYVILWADDTARVY